MEQTERIQRAASGACEFSVGRSFPRPPPSSFRRRLSCSTGLQAAVVKDGKAEIRNVGVTRDLGTQVEVDAGVNAGERVILSPPVTLMDGSEVQPRTGAALPAT
jgi:hypothetical protein